MEIVGLGFTKYAGSLRLQFGDRGEAENGFPSRLVRAKHHFAEVLLISRAEFGLWIQFRCYSPLEIRTTLEAKWH